jgi:hypothetical protein
MSTFLAQFDWSGGISDNNRQVRLYRKNYFADSFIISKHFDIFSNPGKITPYRDLGADTNDGSTSTGMKQYYVQDFLYASASAKLYGLGKNDSGQTKIVYKADATTGNWTLPTSSEGNGAVQNGCLFEFIDYLWGFQGTNQIFKWGTLSGSPSITNTAVTLGATITSVAQGGVINSLGEGYIAYNNNIVRISPAGTITDAVKTVPVNYKITSLTNYGNYLAIACAPINQYNGKSKVFIWDYSSTLFQDNIDWGEGSLNILETIEGMLVGVTDRYLNNSTGAGRGSLIIQTYSGGSPQVVKEVFTKKLTGVTMPLSKAVKNNRLFFAAKLMSNDAGTEYNEGIWSFGRKSASYPFTLSLDYIDENVNTSGIQAFGTAANYFFISHSGDGSIDKTSSTATYTFTSFYETQIFNFGDASTTKRIEKISITTPPMTGGTLTVKYKVDADTSWTTVGSLSTVGEVGRDFFVIESTQLPFATFGEIRFRIESTGGAELTGFKFETENLFGSTG